MFFEKELLSFNLFEVVEMKQKNVDMHNKGRNYNALSYRFKSDAVLKTETEEVRMQDNCVSYVPARVDYLRSAAVDEFIVVHFDTTDYKTKRIESFVPKEPERISGLFEEIYECWRKKELGYKYRCARILYEILEECYVQNYVEGAKKTKIQGSVEYLFENYKKSDLTIKEIADRSFMSEVYFRKLFKAQYGISPQKFIVDLRIQNAVGLISTGYYSLKEVAAKCGYRDYKYFSVEFKRIMGVSPSEYSYNYRG